MIKNNRNGILSIVFALFVFLAFMGTAHAAPAVSTVGVVDYLYLINQHPDTPKANEALKTEQEQLKKEFADKSANMSAQEKQEFDQQLGLRLEQKRQQLLQSIAEKVNVAIKAVADSKGLSIVIEKNTTIYGGTDITDEVLKKITGK